MESIIKMALFVDSNILFDAKECDIYKNFLSTANDIYIETTMLKDEIQSPPDYAEELLHCGLKTFNITSHEFNVAISIYKNNPKLSIYDCIACTASKFRHLTLVTGDKQLRKIAQANNIEVHGFIWVLQQCNLDDTQIISIVQKLIKDNTRRIPKKELVEAFPIAKSVSG